MTVTRRVLILCAALVQSGVLLLLLVRAYDEDRRIVRDARETRVLEATRPDSEAPFTWRLSWSQWSLRRGGAHLSFAPERDDGDALTRLRSVRAVRIRMTEHWYYEGRCEDQRDDAIGAKELALDHPFGDRVPFIEVPVARNLCTHVTMTFDESGPRSDVRRMNAYVEGEMDGELSVGGNIGLIFDNICLGLGLLSLFTVVWSAWTVPRAEARETSVLSKSISAS